MIKKIVRLVPKETKGCLTQKEKECMCKEFRDQIERGEAGVCHCGLYRLEID